MCREQVSHMNSENAQSENPKTCKHQDLDKRGSSKFTARFFCKQCGTFVDEMPQAKARRRRQLGKDIATLPSNAIDTTERVIGAENDDVCLDQEGAYHMMTLFQQDLDLELPLSMGSLQMPLRLSERQTPSTASWQ